MKNIKLNKFIKILEDAINSGKYTGADETRLLQMLDIIIDARNDWCIRKNKFVSLVIDDLIKKYKIL